MGKRPRTPHFRTGLGDGNVGLLRKTSKQGYSGKYNQEKAYIRKRAKERIMDPPAELWTDVFRNAAAAASGDGIPRPVSTAGPWQVSAFCLLGMIVVLSAIFLHLVTDSGDKNRPNSRAGAAAARRVSKVKRKKTDEWSEDEDEQHSDGGAYRADNEGAGGGVGSATASAAHGSSSSPLLYYPYQPRFPNVQEHRHRKPSVGGIVATTATASTKELLGQGNTVISNSTLHNRNYYVNQSGTVAAAANFSTAPPSRKNSRSPRLTPLQHQQQQHHLLSSTGLEGFETTLTASESMGGEKVTTSTLDQFNSPHVGLLRPFEMVRQLSPASSMASMEASSVHNNSNDDDNDGSISPMVPVAFMPLRDVRVNNANPGAAAALHGVRSAHPTAAPRKSSSLELSSASDDFDMEETPRAGRYTRQTMVDLAPAVGGGGGSGLLPPPALLLNNSNHNKNNGPYGVRGGAPTFQDMPKSPARKESTIPFIPRLEESADSLQLRVVSKPAPHPISVEELRLVQMETGNAPPREPQQQPQQQPRVVHQAYPGRAVPIEEKITDSSSSTATSSDSGGRDEPRKSIQHKRPDLTLSTDSASSLQSSIDYSELNLKEVIGGGGFGQVWRAMWRGTPVAVKVLTGTAQSKKVSKAILEEFAAEINLLKGMRHPNICLYMGACLEPPNRAIVTELAANGSVWDALRLPLSPPFVACDGVTRDGWPLNLYQPDSRHGAPPTSFMARKEPPIPPKGTWPWALVKKVACGAARGMAYLHSGKPPVLHRDLKSANLLLDESYTTKVCDFGLSRLKSQNQSMTGNCGTVQWMAPEVLANQKYAESADVFSFGIICWELLSRECPYDGMSAIQCALAVLHRDFRPEIPTWCPPAVSALIKTCVKRDPETRPTFTQIILALDSMP